MDIDEKIRLEEDRYYEKIKELNDILKMYNNNARENAAYVDRNVNQAASFGIDPDRIISYEESRQYSNPYAKQIEEIKADIEKENELHEKNMADLRRQKQEIDQQRMEDELARERERQQREIELINLQQEINRIENERLEIEKRLRTISMETLGSYFSKQIAERYPEEYQQFQQSKEQVRNLLRNANQISDLKERFSKVSDDLKLYQGALPVYESYYQRYQEMVKERQQQRAIEKEQEDIYNLIHSSENERLKSNRSLYTAYDLGNKTIPQEYQGMTYEQVADSIKQKEAEEKARQEAKATRDELIGKAIRKDLMVPEDYHLSQLQIKNLSEQFSGYSNEELQEFINGSKKQEVIPEVQSPLTPESPLQPVQQQSDKEIQMPEIKKTSTSNYDDFEKNLISFIETKNSNLGKVSEIISVTGYPDSTYEVRFESGEIHQITVTQDEKNMIRNQSHNQQAQQEYQNNDSLINDIIGRMADAGEFSHIPLEDVSQRIDTMNMVKKGLQEKSIDELEIILNSYANQEEKTEPTGMHR